MTNNPLVRSFLRLIGLSQITITWEYNVESKQLLLSATCADLDAILGRIGDCDRQTQSSTVGVAAFNIDMHYMLYSKSSNAGSSWAQTVLYCCVRSDRSRDNIIQMINEQIQEWGNNPVLGGRYHSSTIHYWTPRRWIQATVQQQFGDMSKRHGLGPLPEAP